MAGRYRDSLGWRVVNRLAHELDARIGWHRLPKFLGLATLLGIRNVLRRSNLFDTTHQPSVDAPGPPPFPPAALTERTPDGSWNSLDDPAMGMAGTRFGRNVPIGATRAEPADRLLEPSP